MSFLLVSAFLSRLDRCMIQEMEKHDDGQYTKVFESFL